MQKWLFILILSSALLIQCQKDQSGVDLFPSGSFTYLAYDTTGNLLVRGWFTFELIDSAKIEGSWDLDNLSSRTDIGPQAGKGQLVGWLNGESISINLNPNYADHNVFLEGEIKNDLIEGKWMWGTFIGITNWGPFRATKN